MSYGTGDPKYDLVEGWAKLLEDWSFLDVSSITIDLQDNVYILDRGGHPIIVLDREGNLLDSWGEKFFNRAHGSCIGTDGSIYYTDDRNHFVAKFTHGGKLLARWGNIGKDKESALFHAPHAIAVDSRGDIYVGDASMTGPGIDKGPNAICKFALI